MSDFMPEPSLLLPDREALIASLMNPVWMEWPFPKGWHVKSQWLCDEMDTYGREIGFAYNLAVQRYLEKREGWPEHDENSSALARLIYNAQRYRRSDKLRRDGFEPLTETFIAKAGEGASVVLKAENVLLQSIDVTYKVRRVGEKLYLMAPRKKKYAVNPQGQPARLVA